MKKDFLTLSDVDLKNKTVLIRVDINVPYDAATKTIKDSDRLREHAKTIKELSDKGARVVVLAHQGRKGDPDFIHLDQHAKLLEKHVGRKVQFIADVAGERAQKKIESLSPKDILLLDNVRFLDDESEEKSPEEHADSQIVLELSPLADIFVNDAFSASHRSHASVVGFTETLPSYAGRVMEKELVSCEKALNPKRPNIFIFGGAKPDDCIAIMENMLDGKMLDTALTCGTVGELFLIAKGINLGGKMKFYEEKDFMKLVPQAKQLLEKYGSEIEIPVDVAIDENGRQEISTEELPVESAILDIGTKTAKKYADIIKDAKTIVVKGPAGAYEKQGFDVGTKLMLEAISSSKAFSLIGGGDTLVAIEKIGMNKNKFSYISLGGGALITYLSGKPMPGVEVLKAAAKK
ncbi:MAG TPA: phosphoglycerate kinase [archaeon]|nr:phosphoglycerate kinase [archaeon]